MAEGKETPVKSIMDRLEGLRTDGDDIDELPPKASSLVDGGGEVQVELADPSSDTAQSIHYQSATSFEELRLGDELLKGVYAMGYERPSRIQAKALPLLMKPPHTNFIGQSQSGTGKTAAFTLAVLSRVDPALNAPQAIILAPARELANQILTVVKQMSQFTQIKSTQALKDSVPRGQSLSDHVIVGTPGTVQDLLRRRAIDSTHIKIFVIDEADVMLDQQNLGDQTIRVKKLLPRNCQVVLFSATYRDDVRLFAEKVVPSANMIRLKREELSVDKIKQLYVECKNEDEKYEVLCSIYGLCNIGQSIIFCERRDTAEKIAQRMGKDGHQVSVLHGKMEPADRDRIFNMYVSGEAKVLITTNVMARGIDISDVNLVINYDLPLDGRGQPDFETYLHRIGRTGRFGRSGISINFVHDMRSADNMKKIEDYFGKSITRIATDDLMTLEKELKDALKGR